jgi:hypothetical protein
MSLDRMRSITARCGVPWHLGRFMSSLRSLRLSFAIVLALASCRVVTVDCRVDDDCDNDEICEDNECIECQRNRDCDDDEECNDGVCEPAEGEGEGEEGEGEGEGEGEAPRRNCTSQFGDIITVGSGRLDGTLVSIVMPNFNGCRGDDNHIHLQVDVDGEVYDVAINTSSEFNDQDPRVGMAAAPMGALPGAPWSEGWHAGEVASYTFDLGVASEQFVPMESDVLADEVVDALRTAGQISVFMVGFDDGTGGHKVHKNSNGTDGLLVINPEGASPTGIGFRFQDQFF